MGNVCIEILIRSTEYYECSNSLSCDGTITFVGESGRDGHAGKIGFERHGNYVHIFTDCKEYSEYNGADASTASSYTDQVLGKEMNMVYKITVFWNVLEHEDSSDNSRNVNDCGTNVPETSGELFLMLFFMLIKFTENDIMDSWEDDELLDYNILLTEADIPGASLDGKRPEELNVPQLKRWLACRGAPVSGKKPELIDR